DLGGPSRTIHEQGVEDDMAGLEHRVGGGVGVGGGLGVRGGAGRAVRESGVGLHRRVALQGAVSPRRGQV
ncbi:hypothetical protein QM806_41420, partial [Rhodococcus sp. IEGM 1351]|uniref:hypothetical protein n=1 Tax=Rhodococcus sp. IEGM 1351 TaxID=3047089 RepID=UPI0024B863FB